MSVDHSEEVVKCTTCGDTQGFVQGRFTAVILATRCEDKGHRCTPVVCFTETAPVSA